MIATTHFNFDTNNRTFVAEVSELGSGFHFEQIHPEACDLGLKLFSQRLGSVISYVLSETLQNSDQEVVAWRLVPTLESERKHPQCKGTQVLLVND